MLADGKARTSDQLVCCLTSFKWNLEWEGLHLCRSCKSYIEQIESLAQPWALGLLADKETFNHPGMSPESKNPDGWDVVQWGKRDRIQLCKLAHTPVALFAPFTFFLRVGVFTKKDSFGQFVWIQYFFGEHISWKAMLTFLRNKRQYFWLILTGEGGWIYMALPESIFDPNLWNASFDHRLFSDRKQIQDTIVS